MMPELSSQSSLEEEESMGSSNPANSCSSPAIVDSQNENSDEDLKTAVFEEAEMKESLGGEEDGSTVGEENSKQEEHKELFNKEETMNELVTMENHSYTSDNGSREGIEDQLDEREGKEKETEVNGAMETLLDENRISNASWEDVELVVVKIQESHDIAELETEAEPPKMENDTSPTESGINASEESEVEENEPACDLQGNETAMSVTSEDLEKEEPRDNFAEEGEIKEDELTADGYKKEILEEAENHKDSLEEAATEKTEFCESVVIESEKDINNIEVSEDIEHFEETQREVKETVTEKETKNDENVLDEKIADKDEEDLDEIVPDADIEKEARHETAEETYWDDIELEDPREAEDIEEKIESSSVKEMTNLSSGEEDNHDAIANEKTAATETETNVEMLDKKKAEMVRPEENSIQTKESVLSGKILIEATENEEILEDTKISQDVCSGNVVSVSGSVTKNEDNMDEQSKSPSQEREKKTREEMKVEPIIDREVCTIVVKFEPDICSDNWPEAVSDHSSVTPHHHPPAINNHLGHHPLGRSYSIGHNVYSTLPMVCEGAI